MAKLVSPVPTRPAKCIDLFRVLSRMNNITTKVPYMTTPGNHEAACAEFDGPNNELTAYLNNNEANSTAPNSTLTYSTLR